VDKSVLGKELKKARGYRLAGHHRRHAGGYDHRLDHRRQLLDAA
jgi:hypothetical protein